MRDMDAINGPVVFHDWLHCGLPVDTLFTPWFDSKEVGVFQLDKQAGAVAEVTPHRVPDDLHAVTASSLQGGGLSVEP